MNNYTKDSWNLVGDIVRELPELDHGLYSFIGSNIIIHQVGLTKEQSESNARLIASAPELLEALQDLVEIAENYQIDGKYMNKAKQAIAKAINY